MAVSKKYAKRSLARYSIFWSLENIGSLPNPDPTDLAPWDKNAKLPNAKIDPIKEQQRAMFRVQAQEWAGLTVDSTVRYFSRIRIDMLLIVVGRAVHLCWPLVSSKRSRPDCGCFPLGPRKTPEYPVNMRWPSHRPPWKVCSAQA